ncbi:MAG TPA: winged helix-turn-helix domain-containing protein [Gaiellaceae bacterium]|nr:winged helix-turn-helix domain-containing protein [Gaiellaceae bacterium]
MSAFTASDLARAARLSAEQAQEFLEQFREQGIVAGDGDRYRLTVKGRRIAEALSLCGAQLVDDDRSAPASRRRITTGP